jgi:hypothetical protein
VEDHVSGKEEADRWYEAQGRMRRIETVRGRDRHWKPDRPRARTSSSALRRIEQETTRLDVVCRRRLIARVIDKGREVPLELMIEAVPVTGGWGTALTFLPLGSVGLIVVCRCSERTHELDPGKLRHEAWQGKPGHPRVVVVRDVLA